MQSRSMIYRGLCREEQQEGFPGVAATLTQGAETTCPRVIRICNPGRTRVTSFLRMEAMHIRERVVAVVEAVALRVELTT